MSILFAATYPERTRALVLYGAYAHFHTWVMGREALADYIRVIDETWGAGGGVARFAPERARDERFRAWWARFERHSASPTAAAALALLHPTARRRRRPRPQCHGCGRRHLAAHCRAGVNLSPRPDGPAIPQVEGPTGSGRSSLR